MVKQNRYKYASVVIVFAKFNNKWLLCKHKNRNTWEICGGHIEPNETILQAAKREVFEESGAIIDAIKIEGTYSFEENNIEKCGVYCSATIKEIKDLPDFEMKEIALFQDFPRNTTYPEIYTKLLKSMEKK